MSRPEAIEAAARAIAGCTFKPGTVDRMFGPVSDLHLIRDASRRQAEAAAPPIESALLDRIEEAVKEMRASEEGRSLVWARSYSTACDEVLAVLSQIREGK